jgi:pimeloyl-ACP methyl ester carboxylesterase
MPTVKVRDIQIYYQETGQGDPLVLLMGWGGDHTAWALQIPAFAGEFRCITPDNRGAGRSDQPDIAYTIRMMADDTVGLMDALGIQRAHVGGLSMGGMIAQEIAINCPERVRTLQLHAALARIDPFLRAIGQALIRARAASSREEFIRTLLPWILTPRTYAERPEFVELMVQRLLENPYPASLTGLTRQGEACWAHDTVDRLGRIRCPTLITVGAEDIFVPLRFSRVLQERIPGAELLVIEGGGHGYVWEVFEVFNDACLRFLRRHRNT